MNVSKSLPSRKRSGVALVMGVAALATAFTVAPAQAGSALCPASAVCLYDNDNFSALLGYRTTSQGIMNMSSAADNALQSWENKRSTNAAWYDDPNGGGTCNTMQAKRENASLGIFSRNGASSWKTNGGC